MVNKKNYRALYHDFWELHKQSDQEFNFFMDCVVCEKRIYEGATVVHNFAHIKSKGAYPELAMDLNNIAFKCVRCHLDEHSSGTATNYIIPNA